MKALGYVIYIPYTTYTIPDPIDDVLLNNESLVPYLQGTKTPGMLASLQACASAPSNVIQASEPADIDAGLTKLLQSAITNGGRFVN